MSLFVKDGGVWKESGAGGLSVKDANAWKPVDSGFVKDAGVWKQFYQNIVYYTQTAIPGNDTFNNANGIYLDPGFDASGNLYYAWIGGSVFYVQKIDASGSLVWSKSIPRNSNDTQFGSFLVDSSGNSYLSPRDSTDVSLIKLNSSGVVQYSKLYDSGFSVRGLDFGPSGSILITGALFTNGNRSIILQVNSSTGAVIQNRDIFFGSAQAGIKYGSALDSSGNIYAVNTRGGTSGDIIKFNSSFTVQWIKTYSSNSGLFFDVVTDASGNVYASGRYNGFPGIVKFDSSGNFQWGRRIDQSGSSGNAEALLIDASGNLYTMINDNNSQGYVLKFDQSGSLVWQRRIAVAGSSYLSYGIGLDGATGLCIFGRGIANTTLTARLLKVPQDGSKTGTYGDFTWAASSISITVPNITPGNSGFSYSSSSISISERNKVSSNATGTFNTTIIP